MTRKIAVAASTTFELTPALGAQIVDAMLEYGEDAVFLTRGKVVGFDAFIAACAIGLGRRCFGYPGGRENWARDEEMAADCDLLLAFMDPGQLDNTKSGTGHLIECVLAAGKPVRAATVVNDNLVWAES